MDYAFSRDLTAARDPEMIWRLESSLERTIAGIVEQDSSGSLPEEVEDAVLMDAGWKKTMEIVEILKSVFRNFSPSETDPPDMMDKIITPVVFMESIGDYRKASTLYGCYALLNGVSPSTVAWYIGGFYSLELRKGKGKNNERQC
ncbi:hypothetical protein LptCag_1602 [Leptospirillum ferriphilum]|nr:hypothetical protein LptCag_1602 [Leptospirillum ferriphilum]